MRCESVQFGIWERNVSENFLAPHPRLKGAESAIRGVKYYANVERSDWGGRLKSVGGEKLGKRTKII